MSNLGNLNEILAEAREVLAQTSQRSRGSEDFEEVSYDKKSELFAKFKFTIEQLYEELEVQKIQRREAELWAKEQEARNFNLDKRCKELNSKYNKTKEKHQDLKESLESLENENASLKRLDAKYSQTKKMLHEEKEELKNELEKLKTELERKDEAMKEWDESVYSFEEKLGKLEEENTELRSELEEWKQKYEEIHSKYSTLESQLQVSEAVAEKLNKAQENYESYFQQHQNLATQTQSLIEEKLQALQTHLNQQYSQKQAYLQDSLTQLCESLQFNNQENTKIKHENETLKAQIADLEKKLQNSLQEAHKATPTDQDKQKIIQLETKLGEERQAYNHLSRQLTECQDRIKVLNKQLEEVSYDKERQETTRLQMAEELEYITKSHQQQVESLKTRHQQSIKELSAKIREEVTQEVLWKTQQENTKENQSLQSRLTELHRMYTRLQEKLKQDTAFFTNEASRKDAELLKVKNRLKAKLDYAYSECERKLEYLREEVMKILTKLNTNASQFTIVKLLEDLLNCI